MRVRSWLHLVGLAGLVVAALAPVRPGAAQAGSHWLYLPLVFKAPTCLLNPQEQQIAEYMRTHPEQQRASLTCDPILAQVARARAQDMADRAYFGHTNPDGFGPNHLVRQAGYPLPGWYGSAPDSNNIESIAAGNSTAAATWNQWMGSDGHRLHLLGQHPFWAEQIEYGIGYVAKPGSPYTYYWVAITAKRGP